MTRGELVTEIHAKRSYLCIGLDTDIEKIPKELLRYPDPVFEFNRRIIEATHTYCVAYKPNIAFYESQGPKGWKSLQKTLDCIPNELFTIADAKRGDIGNTSALYAKTFFQYMDFDALTVSPYMGEDSIRPFLEFDGKWVILLAHTSNTGSADFQSMESTSGRPLYEEVILRSQRWASPDQLMYVVGATRADTLVAIRKLAPDYFFLVPGMGAQGGDLNAVSIAGMNKECGLLVNSSRAIIYASAEMDFAEVAAREAKAIRDKMDTLLKAASF
jgi:orotidine-5'-phosphate decarboxylase